MEKIDVLILSWHQVYLSGYAGGYIRLREFLKRFPTDLKYCILDNTPSIYTDITGDSRVIEYNSPFFIRILRKKVFYIWFLCEIIFTIYALYKNGKKIIEAKKPKVIYVPIGEFPHCYFSAILLKIRYPRLKIVIDILNFGIPEKRPSPMFIFKLIKKSNINILRGTIMVITGYFQYFLETKTINHMDYIFTVSPELVKVIKEIYKKNSIDYTPSGVSINKNDHIDYSRKKYLAAYVGRMTVQKGVFSILQVWSKVVRALPNAKLALVGFVDEMTEKKITKAIDELHLRNNIECFYGVTNDKKNEIILSSDLFLHLADFEPLFPVIGILEGFARGLPAIVFDMNAVSDYKKNARLKSFLYVIKNGDLDAVSKKILQYSKLPNSIKAKIALSSKKYAAGFDWNIIAAKEFKVIYSMSGHESYV